MMDRFRGGTRRNAALGIVVTAVLVLVWACMREQAPPKAAVATYQEQPASPVAQQPVATTGGGPTRTEKDLLGEKEVPADAYYGVQTARALENFQLSGIPINHYPGFI